MYCRTDISSLYWSRGEVSFLTHHWKMRIGSLMMSFWSEVSEPLNWAYYHLSPGPSAFGFKMRTGTLPTSFFRVVLFATSATLRICFLLSRLALLGIFLFFLFQFFAVFDHVAFFLAVVASDVRHLPSGQRGFGLSR